MKSMSWNEIQQIFEDQFGAPNDSVDADAKRMVVNHVFKLIPVLKESKVLASVERNVGHFMIHFYTPGRKSWVTIAPPHPHISGSTTEFRVDMYRQNANQEWQCLDEKLLLLASLDEIVRTAENFFLQLLKDDDIVSREP